MLRSVGKRSHRLFKREGMQRDAGVVVLPFLGHIVYSITHGSPRRGLLGFMWLGRSRRGVSGHNSQPNRAEELRFTPHLLFLSGEGSRAKV